MTERMLEKELGGELLLYDMGRERMHVLNETARLVYQLHQQGKTPPEIEAAVRERFDVPREAPVLEDIRRFLAELAQKEGG